MTNAIKKFFQANAFQLTMQILTVAGLILAMYITTRLAPLTENIRVITTEVEALQEFEKSENVNDVHNAEFNQVVERINHISNRVDAIYSIIAK